MWLLYIVKHVPADTGFLIGAFGPLAEMLNVKIMSAGRGKLDTARLKSQIGFANVRQQVLQLQRERERRRRFLKQAKMELKEAKQRQREEKAQRNTEGVRVDATSEELISGVEGFGAGADKQVSKRERKEGFFMASYRRLRLVDRYKRNKTKFAALKKKIAVLRKKLKKIKAKQVNYRKLKESIYTNQPYAFRRQFKTVTETIKGRQRTLAEIRAKMPPIKDQVITKKIPIKRGDADSFRDVYRKRYYPGRGQPKGPIKTPTSGRKYATDPESIFVERTQPPVFLKGTEYSEIGVDQTQPDGKVKKMNITGRSLKGNAVGDPTKLTYVFTYDVEIAYYKIMDFLGRYKNHGKAMRPPGTPWLSQRGAGPIFEKFLQDNLPKRLPFFTDYKVKTKSTLKGSSFTRGFK